MLKLLIGCNLMGLLLTALDRCCVFAHEYAWQGRKRIEKLGGLLSEVLCIILERDSHDLVNIYFILFRFGRLLGTRFRHAE